MAMIDKLPELIDLVQQAEDNRLLKCGGSKKSFVMSGIRILLGESEFSEYKGVISSTIDMLVTVGHDPNVLNFANRYCGCLRSKKTKKV
jgi:hypothetical protein